MISKTKIGNRIRKKKNPDVVATVLEAKKHEAWRKVAQMISSSRRKYSSVNFHEIERKTKAGDTVVVPGKVLGSGILDKKIRICALAFSESAREKATHSKSELIFLIDEMKKNPKAEGIKIIE